LIKFVNKILVSLHGEILGYFLGKIRDFATCEVSFLLYFWEFGNKNTTRRHGMDIKQTLMQALKKDVKIDLERKLEKVRIPCMNYLKENALRIFKEKITEVYKINSDRIQVIDLPLFLKAVKIVDTDGWSFNISADEDLLNYKTKSGEPIYQYSNNGMYGDTYGKEVHNWKEYWHDPINGVHEEDWYLEVASEDIEKFIKNDFIKFVKDKIDGGK